ncbi:MAG: carbon-nitrogen hydrolase family protein [Gemmatimonadaceae bacterium]
MKVTIALVSDVFHDAAGPLRLAERLRDAAARGADLAALPELPLNAWSPATKTPHDSDAEPPAGARHQALSRAAREAAIAVVGGAIVRDPETSRRHNTALVFDKTGRLVSSYRKLHLPEENGFWETHHYEPGDALPPVLDLFPLRIGLQICSDINRPEVSHLLGAMGADVIITPRATEAATFHRWRMVFIANAMTSGVYVLSVNRPRGEFGVAFGGPSFAVAPTGEVLVETTEAIALVTLDRAVVQQARRQYPGYLAHRADLYADGWRKVKTTTLPNL